MRDALRRIVGPGRVLTGRRAADWRVHGRLPRAVVVPGSAPELAAVLELAVREGWCVEPAGAGTWLNAGPAPRSVDLVLSTARLDAVLEYEPEDLTAAVGAGISLGTLAATLARRSQWLPLDPAGVPEGTLGATIATASSGPLRYGHGTPRDHVLGLELATGDGRLLRLGGKVVKNVAGYDLTRLAVGSHGTLGVITAANVRLRAVPERDVTVRVGGPERARLLDVVAGLAGRPLEPVAIELVSPVLGRSLLGEPGGWHLLARYQGSAAVTRAAEVELRRVAPGAHTLPAEAAHALWQGLARAEADAGVMIRLADLPARLDGTLVLAAQIAAAGPRAEEWAVAAHAGDGVARLFLGAAATLAVPPGTVAPDDAAAAGGGWAALADGIAAAREELARRRGTLVVRAAPAAVTERVATDPDPGPLRALMGGIKREFDPAGILAPARFAL
jgi:glycolate oxidase FAD binding subunit